MLYQIILNNNYSAEDAIIMFLISIFVFFISLTLHEFAHGFAAYKMGDPTPKIQGRLTLNPVKHLDPMGLMCFIFFGFGWAKPVQVNPTNFKKFKTGTKVVSIAGVLANLLLGFLAAGIMAILLLTVGIPNTAMAYVYSVLEMFMMVNSFLFMFNILPIFPLDGFNFISSFLKPNNKFVQFNHRNGNKLMWGIILGSLIFELFFSIDVLSWYLSVLYNYVFSPIAFLGVL